MKTKVFGLVVILSLGAFLGACSSTEGDGGASPSPADSPADSTSPSPTTSPSP